MTIPAPTGGPNKRALEAWVESVRAVAVRGSIVLAANDLPEPLAEIGVPPTTAKGRKARRRSDELALLRRSPDLIRHSFAKVIGVIEQIENPMVREHAYFAIHELISTTHAVGSCATVSASAGHFTTAKYSDAEEKARGSRKDHKRREKLNQFEESLDWGAMAKPDRSASVLQARIIEYMGEGLTGDGYPSDSTTRQFIRRLKAKSTTRLPE